VFQGRLERVRVRISGSVRFNVKVSVKISVRVRVCLQQWSGQ